MEHISALRFNAQVEQALLRVLVLQTRVHRVQYLFHQLQDSRVQRRLLRNTL